MKWFKNNKGMTLVEVVVSIAILGILTSSVLNIFTNSYSLIFSSGKSNKGFYNSVGELEIAINDSTYNGKNDVDTVKRDDTMNFNFKIPSKGIDKTIDTILIKSKIGNLETPLNESSPNADPFLYMLSVKNTGSSAYNGKDAFIDKNNNKIYDIGEIIVSPAKLNGLYTYRRDGILVIPTSEALTSSKQNVIWEVKDGIYFKINITPKILLETTASKRIDIKATNGDIDIEEVSIISNDSIKINASGVVKTNGSIIRSKNDIRIIANGNVDLTGATIETSSSGNSTVETKGEINVSGTNVLPFQIFTNETNSVFKAGTSTLGTKILVNQFTYIKDKHNNPSGVNTYAINEYNSDIIGGYKDPVNPERFYYFVP